MPARGEELCFYPADGHDGQQHGEEEHQGKWVAIGTGGAAALLILGFFASNDVFVSAARHVSANHNVSINTSDADAFAAVHTGFTGATGSSTAVAAALFASTVRNATAALAISLTPTSCRAATTTASAAVVATNLAGAVWFARIFDASTGIAGKASFAATVGGAIATVFTGTAGTIATTLNGIGGATTAIADADTDANVVILGITAVSVDFANASFASAAAATGTFFHIAARTGMADTVGARATIGTLTAASTAAIITTALASAIWFAGYALAADALLARTASRVTATGKATIDGVGTGGVFGTIGSTVIEITLPAAELIVATSTIDAEELSAITPHDPTSLIAATFVSETHAVGAAGFVGAEALYRNSGLNADAFSATEAFAALTAGAAATIVTTFFVGAISGAFYALAAIADFTFGAGRVTHWTTLLFILGARGTNIFAAIAIFEAEVITEATKW